MSSLLVIPTISRAPRLIVRALSTAPSAAPFNRTVKSYMRPNPDPVQKAVLSHLMGAHLLQQTEMATKHQVVEVVSIHETAKSIPWPENWESLPALHVNVGGLSAAVKTLQQGEGSVHVVDSGDSARTGKSGGQLHNLSHSYLSMHTDAGYTPVQALKNVILKRAGMLDPTASSYPLIDISPLTILQNPQSWGAYIKVMIGYVIEGTLKVTENTEIQLNQGIAAQEALKRFQKEHGIDLVKIEGRYKVCMTEKEIAEVEQFKELYEKKGLPVYEVISKIEQKELGFSDACTRIYKLKEDGRFYIDGRAKVLARLAENKQLIDDRMARIIMDPVTQHAVAIETTSGKLIKVKDLYLSTGVSVSYRGLAKPTVATIPGTGLTSFVEAYGDSVSMVASATPSGVHFTPDAQLIIKDGKVTSAIFAESNPQNRADEFSSIGSEKPDGTYTYFKVTGGGDIGGAHIRPDVVEHALAQFKTTYGLTPIILQASFCQRSVTKKNSTQYELMLRNVVLTSGQGGKGFSSACGDAEAGTQILSGNPSEIYRETLITSHK